MMLPIEWFFRQAWRWAAGLPEEARPGPVADIGVLRVGQWNADFENLMRNRLIMGAFRYGSFEQQRDIRYDNAESIAKHLDAYLATGNAEHLVDIANLALVEFTRPFHPAFHWEATDDDHDCHVLAGTPLLTAPSDTVSY